LSTEIHCFCSDLDVVTFTIAALGHDVGHPGLTNRFLVTSRDKLAIQYNDSSILENMHCAILFSLMSQGFDVMAEIEDEEWISCRKMIINMILDTDLSKHFEICSRFKGRVLVNEQEKMVIENLEDKNLIFSMGLKCADIGHSAKAKELHLKWTTLVMEEFFIQGDIEKQLALSVSIYCDRNNTDIAKSQAGFIRNICIPIFETWTTFVKSESVDSCLKQLRENYLYWDDTYKNKKWISVEKLD
jgi:3',5'-cyclic-nucleotide phosphodiesterase/cAMP-specific phosphodiesterase 4